MANEAGKVTASKGVTKFEIYVGANNLFQWKYVDPEGEAIVVSKGTPIKEQCYQEIRNVKENATIEHRYEKLGEEGKFSFRLRAANHQVVAESISYQSVELRDIAMSVMRRASEAGVLGAAI